MLVTVAVGLLLTAEALGLFGTRHTFMTNYNNNTRSRWQSEAPRYKPGHQAGSENYVINGIASGASVALCIRMQIWGTAVAFSRPLRYRMS